MSYTTPTAGPKGWVGCLHDFSSLKAAAPSVHNRRSEWIFQLTPRGLPRPKGLVWYLHGWVSAHEFSRLKAAAPSVVTAVANGSSGGGDIIPTRCDAHFYTLSCLYC